MTPSRPFFRESQRCSRWSPANGGGGGCAIAVCAFRVAVRADDVALVDLLQQPPPSHEERPSGHDVEALLCRVAMVEVHRIRREFTAAVRARSRAKLPKK